MKIHLIVGISLYYIHRSVENTEYKKLSYCGRRIIIFNFP